MKKTIMKLGIAVTVLVLMNACSVEKRIYRNGFNVEWHSNLKKVKNQSNVEAEVEVASTVETEKEYQTQNIAVAENVTTDNLTSDNTVQENNAATTFTVASEETTTPTVEETKEVTVSVSKKEANVKSKSEAKQTIKQINGQPKSKIEKTKSAGSLSNDDLIGIILCLVGLAPFGVMIAKGKRSSQFKVNLMLWVGGLACYIVGIVIAVATLSFVGVIFTALGGLLLLASFIHGLISILK